MRESLACDSGSGRRDSRDASDTIVGESDAASVAAKPRATAGWGRVALNAKLTGRVATTEAETRLAGSLGVQRFGLG